MTVPGKVEECPEHCLRSHPAKPHLHSIFPQWRDQLWCRMSLLVTPSCHLVSRKSQMDPWEMSKTQLQKTDASKKNKKPSICVEFNALFSHSTTTYWATCQTHARLWDARINNTQHFKAQRASKHGKRPEVLWGIREESGKWVSQADKCGERIPTLLFQNPRGNGLNKGIMSVTDKKFGSQEGEN